MNKKAQFMGIGIIGMILILALGISLINIEISKTHEWKCLEEETRCYKKFNGILGVKTSQIDCDRDYDIKKDVCINRQLIEKNNTQENCELTKCP